jgi:molybdopterin/thiamine biosynthesis adenylyltransferase
VGTIGIAEGDVVDESNLQRQIIHFTEDVGRPKLESAREKLIRINPDLKVIGHPGFLNAANAVEIISGYDFVIDGTDNFPAKFLINDACVIAGKAFSHAGILRFEGQTMTVVPGKSRCYRCLFREPPPANAVPSCAEAGVLGAIAGVMGTLQATEALKYLLGKGDLLTARSGARAIRNARCAGITPPSRPRWIMRYRPALTEFEVSRVFLKFLDLS